ncbi:MAG: MXAN_5187 C-terminal domain-containing protein [Myxococcota bacterium]|jgi:hypothetical protein|nr:MXAN_5187 C-terminal domain-containing protein [Myxococcota bacterium]
MFQLKISGAIVLVVLTIMGFAYFSLTSTVSNSIVEREIAELNLGRQAVGQLRYTAEEALKQSVDGLASDPVVGAELSKLRRLAVETASTKPLNEQSNRLILFNHLLDWGVTIEKNLQAQYGNLNRSDPAAAAEEALTRPIQDWWGAKPDMVLAFVAMPLKQNRTAAVLVAHAKKGAELIAGRDYSQDLPVLMRVIESKLPQTDVIAWDSFEYLAVASPVFDADGFVIGVVSIGYTLDAGLAERLGVSAGGNSLLIFSGERLYAQESATKLKDLFFQAKFEPYDADAERFDADGATELASLKAGLSYLTELDGDEYLVQRQDWIVGSDGVRVGCFLLGHHAMAMKPVSDLQYQIPLVGLVILIVALLLSLYFIRSFVKPLEDIDIGIQEILAGNRDYTFKARLDNPLHAELANSLNHLTAFLQGRRVEGEDGWDQLMVDLEPERPSLYGMQAVQVVSESEKESLKLLYEDYMAKRQELDQHVDMDFERFCRRIKRNETSLKEKHNCKSVEFSVAIADGKVVLKPKPIFD